MTKVGAAVPTFKWHGRHETVQTAAAVAAVALKWRRQRFNMVCLLGALTMRMWRFDGDACRARGALGLVVNRGLWWGGC